MKTLIFLIGQLFYLVNCWGAIGHNLTARIGYDLLNDNTKKLLSECQSINNVDDFESLANWADHAKFTKEYSWSYDLHFCDVYSEPIKRCKLDYKLDCVDERCIISAINNFTKNLHDNYRDRVSLSFIIHFLGDIFQPFHIGYLSDLGGNKIRVIFDKHSTNLHAVWDDYIINKKITESRNDIYVFENEIKHNLNNINKMYPLDPLIFAQNSLSTLCNLGLYYDNDTLISNNHTLSNNYYIKNIEIIKDRISYASYYLSKIINNIYVL